MFNACLDVKQTESLKWKACKWNRNWWYIMIGEEGGTIFVIIWCFWWCNGLFRFGWDLGLLLAIRIWTLLFFDEKPKRSQQFRNISKSYHNKKKNRLFSAVVIWNNQNVYKRNRILFRFANLRSIIHVLYISWASV